MIQVFNTASKIIITCNKRLSTYLQAEVETLGFQTDRVFATGVELTCTLNDCIKLNLNLRCASQVLYAIKSFPAHNADEVYAEVYNLPWEEWIDINGYFSVNSTVHNETITTPLYANLKVKDAIVDRIKSKKELRPNSGSEINKAVVHLYWKDTQAEVFLDTSGETLAKHGYRKHPGKAPLLEALASSIIYASTWNRSTPFINPMCGSGTLAIEAALMATNRTPGLLRMNYAFMHILGYDEEVFFKERRALKDNVTKKCPPIIATDISKEAIEIAQANAKTAGVDQLIEFSVCDFAQTPIPQAAPGVVIVNPEYGQRLGNQDTLAAAYKRIGDFLKQKCIGYTGYIFTANPDLAKKIGLKANQKIEFYNGKLDCRLMEYTLYSGTRRSPENG